MTDVLLAALLSGVGEIPPPAPPEPAPIVAPAPPGEPFAAPPVVRPIPPAPPAVRDEAPLAPTMPRPVAPVVAPRQTTWQLFCTADQQLYRHTDKAFLEQWVAERNAQLATTQYRQPVTFQSPAPGYGYSAGQQQFQGSRWFGRVFASGGCASGNCGR